MPEDVGPAMLEVVDQESGRLVDYVEGEEEEGAGEEEGR